MEGAGTAGCQGGAGGVRRCHASNRNGCPRCCCSRDLGLQDLQTAQVRVHQPAASRRYAPGSSSGGGAGGTSGAGQRRHEIGSTSRARRSSSAGPERRRMPSMPATMLRLYGSRRRIILPATATRRKGSCRVCVVGWDCWDCTEATYYRWRGSGAPLSQRWINVILYFPFSGSYRPDDMGCGSSRPRQRWAGRGLRGVPIVAVVAPLAVQRHRGDGPLRAEPPPAHGQPCVLFLGVGRRRCPIVPRGCPSVLEVAAVCFHRHRRCRALARCRRGRIACRSSRRTVPISTALGLPTA